MTSFVKKGPGSPKKAINGWLLPTLLGLFLFSAGNCLGAFLETDFEVSEGINVGALTGQGGWLEGGTFCGGYAQNLIVSTSTNYHGDQGVYLYNSGGTGACSYINASTAQTGALAFWIKSSTANRSSPTTIYLNQGTASAGIMIFLDFKSNASDILIYDSSGSLACSLDLGTWAKVSVEWNATTDQQKISCSNGETTGWIPLLSNRDITTGIDYFKIINSFGAGAPETLLDFFTEPYTGPGYEPNFTSINPILCEKNVIDFDNVEFEGTVNVPADNPYTFDNIFVAMEAVYTQATTTALTINYFDIPLPSLTGGEKFDYSATTTLSRDNPFWRVRFRFDGYDDFGNRVIFWYVPTATCRTVLTETADLPVEVLEEIGYYEELEPSDCSGLTLTETFLCNIKNILQGIFVPSQEKVAELNQNIQLLSQKFPMNYLSEASDFFSDINSGIEATSTISLSIMDATGTIDFSVWEGEADVGGSTQTVSDIFKGFFSAVIIFGFIVWAINFGKRIFK